MKTLRIFLFALCCATFGTILNSCLKEDNPIQQEDNKDQDTNNPEDETDYEVPDEDDDEELDNNPQEVDYDNAVSIVWNGAEVAITNPLEGNGVEITTNKGHVIINSSLVDTELAYVLSGTTTDGSVKVYGEYKFNLVLNGVGITNPTGAAINIQCGKKISIYVEDETNNRLIDGATYTEIEGEDMKGTIFSEGQLNFYGNGALEIRGKYKHAICSDDYIRMHAGNINIIEAASDAVHSNDYIRIDGGTLTAYSYGEGFDTDGYILIEGGDITLQTSGMKGHGMKAVEYITVNSSGSLDIKTTGTAAKCLSSDGDLTIAKGTLTLKTTGGGYYDSSIADVSSASAIKCDGAMVIENGTITINSSGAGGKGISTDGGLTINDGTISVTTTGTRYVYNNTYNTAAKAIKSDSNLTINGGTITVRTSGTEAEGIESKKTLTITGGTLDVQTYDDAMNASNHIQIDGGNIYCAASNNDGIDSNGTITITGGVVVSAGATSPEEGFDCDNNRFTITGGTLVGIGGATSSPTASYCTQYSLVYGTSSVSAVHIENTSTGADILTFKLPRTYSQTTLLFSSPSLAKSTGYTIYTGGTISGGTEFHGLYTGATYSGGSSASTFTTSSMVTTVGSTSGGGFPGGGGRP
ncbi:MAG: carbohydrate-binding domain-containing protein [Mangrovibacterium sp.]